jgi:hypothetical protein
VSPALDASTKKAVMYSLMYAPLCLSPMSLLCDSSACCIGWKDWSRAFRNSVHVPRVPAFFVMKSFFQSDAAPVRSARVYRILSLFPVSA